MARVPRRRARRRRSWRSGARARGRWPAPGAGGRPRRSGRSPPGWSTPPGPGSPRRSGRCSRRTPSARPGNAWRSVSTLARRRSSRAATTGSGAGSSPAPRGNRSACSWRRRPAPPPRAGSPAEASTDASCTRKSLSGAGTDRESAATGRRRSRPRQVDGRATRGAGWGTGDTVGPPETDCHSSQPEASTRRSGGQQQEGRRTAITLPLPEAMNSTWLFRNASTSLRCAAVSLAKLSREAWASPPCSRMASVKRGGPPVVQVGRRRAHAPQVLGQEHAGAGAAISSICSASLRPHVVALEVAEQADDGAAPDGALLEGAEAHLAPVDHDPVVGLVAGQVVADGGGRVQARG